MPSIPVTIGSIDSTDWPDYRDAFLAERPKEDSGMTDQEWIIDVLWQEAMQIYRQGVRTQALAAAVINEGIIVKP
jgi:hypothetical protein